MDRRSFLKILGVSTLGIGLAGLAGATYANRLELYWLELTQLNIPIANLPEALVGLKIVQLSDLHAGKDVPFDYLEKAFEAANALAPDVLVVTGDFVDHDRQAKYMPQLVPLLAGLKAKYGVFACLGNHDLWSNGAHVLAGIDQAGLRPLVNSHELLFIKGAELVIAGLDDGWYGQPNIQQALNGIPEAVPVILLMHEPDLIDNRAKDERVVLQLSGHSHGGQIRFPILGAPVLPRYGKRYDMGLYRVDTTWLYTNRGVGFTALPARFDCRPEITEFTLVRPA